MLRQLTDSDLGGPITLVDIGAAGRLDPRWRPLAKRLHRVGFEPNPDECARLIAGAHGAGHCRQETFLPLAIGGTNGPATLHRTRSPHCCSTLPPNLPWLRRFQFAELFEPVGELTVELRRLADVPELRTLDVDVLKVDSQGLELPILRTAGRVLERAFVVETETGFVENYQGETTYAQIDSFMRDQGFQLFDLNVRHRVSRRNGLAESAAPCEQILWCEAVWLRDYAADAERLADLGRAKALRVLVLCGLQGCWAFGLELARLFHSQGWLTDLELRRLERPASWRVAARRPAEWPLWALGRGLRLLPRWLRAKIGDELERNLVQRGPVQSFFRRLRKAA